MLTCPNLISYQIKKIMLTFDLYNNMKMLLKIHTKPSVLYKDFLARPLVNKINKNKNQEIV